MNIEKFELKQFDVVKFVNSIEYLIEKVKNGEVNPIELFIVSDVFKNLHEHINKEIKEELEKEISKYPEKKFNYKEYTIIKGTRTLYKFDDEEIKNLEAKLKERKELLKSLKEPMIVESTGEVLNPPTKEVIEYFYVQKK